MSRLDYMVAVGETKYPPTEAQWEELEDEIEAIESSVPIAIKERLGSVPAKHAIFAWKRRHGFLID